MCNFCSLLISVSLVLSRRHLSPDFVIFVLSVIELIFDHNNPRAVSKFSLLWWSSFSACFLALSHVSFSPSHCIPHSKVARFPLQLFIFFKRIYSPFYFPPFFEHAAIPQYHLYNAQCTYMPVNNKPCTMHV